MEKLWQLGWLQDKAYPLIESPQSLVLRRPLMMCSVSIVLGYFLWYRCFAVRKPKVYCGEGKLRSFFLARCPALTDLYWPTWWAVNRHVCTICRVVLQNRPKNIIYDRHTITTADGGTLALDFGVNDALHPLSPILLIIPGLTGDCYMNYILHFVRDAFKSGYRPVVFNQRGTAGLPLRTARLFSATNTEDLESIIDYLKRIYPGAHIVALGVSIGGMILSQYITRTDCDCSLSAVIIISTSFHPFSTQHSLENKWFNKKVYTGFLVNNLLHIVKRNSKVLQRHPSIDFKRIHRVNSLSEFDAAITAPVFGYKSVVDYYADASLVEKLDKIQIPYLALVSSDDPFIPIFGVPVDRFI